MKPALTQIAAAANASPDGAVGQGVDALHWSEPWSLGGDVLWANDAAVLYLMVMKPELVSAIATVVGLNLAGSGLRAATHGGHRPVAAR
jgi:hypothetical protein